MDLSSSIAIISRFVLHRPWQSLQILFRQGQLRPTGLPYRFLSVGNPPLQSYQCCFQKNTSFRNRKMSWCCANNNNSYRVSVLVTWGRPKSARESMISVWRIPEEFLSWNEVYTTYPTFLLYYSRYRAGAFVDLSLSIWMVSLVVLHRHALSLQILFRKGPIHPTGLTYRFLSVRNTYWQSYETCFP